MKEVAPIRWRNVLLWVIDRDTNRTAHLPSETPFVPEMMSKSPDRDMYSAVQINVAKKYVKSNFFTQPLTIFVRTSELMAICAWTRIPDALLHFLSFSAPNLARGYKWPHFWESGSLLEVLNFRGNYMELRKQVERPDIITISQY